MKDKDFTFVNILNIDTTYNRVPVMCKETKPGYHLITVYIVIERISE